MFQFDPNACVEPRDYQKALLATAKRSYRIDQKDLIQVATGGGKTLILSDFAWWNVKQDRKVLIITKDWELLHQAAGDLCRRHPAIDKCGFVGSSPNAKQLFRGMSESPRKKIIFTTIQSWNRRREGWLHPDVILIDELHWGEGAPLYTRLLEKHASRAYILGFTATPRSWTDFRRIGRPYTFQRLIEKNVLAKPVVESIVETGVSWNPERTGSHGDITQTSLRELATNTQRNNLIVEKYLANQEKYQKTLVFACNIEHAELLSRAFVAYGVRAACVHHKFTPAERDIVLRKFRGSQLDVLVNVTMLTHGVDIPDIKTVFLTRPTLSDILFQQMIGRGARRTETKRSYYLVDFIDAIDTYGVPPIRADGYFGSVPVRPGARGISREEHEFAESVFVPMPLVEGYKVIQGLDIAENQTFGVEFELGTASSDPQFLRQRANDLLEVLRQTPVPTADRRSLRSESNYRVWNVVYDSSCGLEVVSRILKGPEGFIEIMDVTRKLREAATQLELTLDSRTGTHVHLGWEFNTRAANRLIEMTAFFEPALMSLVPPSRHRNQYARSLRSNRSFSWTGATKYSLLNLQPLKSSKKTAEVRLHSGTLNGGKILTWTSLWMRMLARVQHLRSFPYEIPAIGSEIFSSEIDGSVKELVSFVQGSDILKLRLMMRRWELAEKHWIENPVSVEWLNELRMESTTNDVMLRLVRDVMNQD